ncbi:MAG: PEP-CTERM sorting domain-containing protein [Planctomycetales bacterium]|nr:PEP-CTERM sorting domain-containing protein [Planctomycetales bacterium]
MRPQTYLYRADNHGPLASTLALAFGLIAPFLSSPPEAIAQTVRYQIFPDVVEAFNHGLAFEQFVSEIGFRYYGAATPVTAGDPCGCNGLGTDGYLLKIGNSVAWDLSDPETTPGYDHVYDNELRFLFRGSGIDLRYAANQAGAPLAWEVVDGGSEGAFNVVASGQFSTLAPTSQLEVAQLVPQGILDTSKLHMLRVKPVDSQVSPAPSEWIALDAFEVYDDKKFTINDGVDIRSGSNPGGSWVPSSSWGLDLDANAIPAIGGGFARTSVDGATMTVFFNGSTVALFGLQDAGLSDGFDWIVDNGGPGREGSVDQALDSDVAYRWPHLLVNDLYYGEHKLVITARNSGNGAGFTQLDGISIISLEDLGVSADFNLDKQVDGEDFLIWQRNAIKLSAARRAEGDANRDGKVDRTDFLRWRREFGNQVDASVAATNAVPEPVSLALLLSATAALASKRRKR